MACHLSQAYGKTYKTKKSNVHSNTNCKQKVDICIQIGYFKHRLHQWRSPYFLSFVSHVGLVDKFIYFIYILAIYWFVK